MTINLPANFKILDQDGLIAWAREQTIGIREEWIDTIDGANHTWAFACREVLFEWRAPKYLVPGSTQALQDLEETSTTAVEKLIIPYEASAGRYGQSFSSVSVEVEHQQGTLRISAQSEDRGTTYGTVFSDTQLVRGEGTGVISLSSSGANGVLVLDQTAIAAQVHRVFRVWVQIQEIVLTNL